MVKVAWLENVEVEISARCCRGWKMQEWNLREGVCNCKISKDCDAAVVRDVGNIGLLPWRGVCVCVGDHDDQLHLLSEASVMYMDATFRVVPSVFHQMFIVLVPYAVLSVN